MDCFYFIDKPIGISSFDVIRTLRKKLNTRKIGHTGTLDPLATGGLILAVGNYTKLIPYLEKDTKEYEFEVMLDGVTDSYDLGEEVNYISESYQKKYKEEITKDKIKSILYKNFSGKIKQIAPKYSALKINGKKAYELAREGKEVNIKAREVTIFDIKILSYNYPKLKLVAKVSAGTYIRSIAHDLGQELGCGGYVSFLRRTKIGNLDIKDSQELDNFDENNLLSDKDIFSDKEFISLESDILEKINNGLKVKGSFDLVVGKDLFVYNGTKITNIVEYDGSELKAKRKI